MNITDIFAYQLIFFAICGSLVRGIIGYCAHTSRPPIQMKRPIFHWLYIILIGAFVGIILNLALCQNVAAPALAAALVAYTIVDLMDKADMSGMNRMKRK